MPGKIVDEDEVLRWFATGCGYRWMQAEYERRYGITTSLSLWSEFRRRKGLERRSGQAVTALVPWRVEERHRWATPLVMLRTEERRRAGWPVPATARDRLRRWRQQLERDGTVVVYDPATPDGFLLVPREDHDTDLVRPPAVQKTATDGSDEPPAAASTLG